MRISDLELLNERIINLLPSDEFLPKKRMLADKAFSMLQKAYEKIGGMKGTGFSSPEDMVQNIPFWKLSISNGHIFAGLFYKLENGRKRVAIFSDGTNEGRSKLAHIYAADFLQNRAYAEVSHSSLAFAKKVLGDKFDEISIPVEQVKSILKDEEIIPINEYEYQRKIGDDHITKRMIGKVTQFT